MKNLKLYMATVVLAMIFCTSNIIAQSNKKIEIPTTILTTFASKYPKATVKNWSMNNNEYTAKAKEGGHKYYATFDENGRWIKTVSKYNWPWKLSPVVRKAFYKSEYGAWHIYGVHIIETPSGEFYQVLIDNTNQPADALHQSVLTVNKVVEYKSTGEFIKEKGTNETSML